MNIQSFSMIGAAYLNPYAYGDLNGANYGVWILSHLLADSKFMTVFSLLFGAGVVLMTSRREGAGKPTAGIHYRRMFWLIVFGLLHGLFLWYGDILYAYGVCGLLVYLFRRRSPKFLLVTGFLVAAVASMLALFFQVTMPYWPPEAVGSVETEWWMPPPEAVQNELDAYRGGWSAQQVVRAPTAIFMQTSGSDCRSWSSAFCTATTAAGMSVQRSSAVASSTTGAVYCLRPVGSASSCWCVRREASDR
jgi:uncharacterized protein